MTSDDYSEDPCPVCRNRRCLAVRCREILWVRAAEAESEGPVEEPYSLAGCPYYATRDLPDAQRGVCDRGCTDEPECVTCEPEGGWPSVEWMNAAYQEPAEQAAEPEE